MSDEELIEKIADEISGITVGEGYYSQTIGINAALEAAKAIAPLLNRVRAEAIRTWADFQDQAIKDLAYVADDADRAEVNRWTVSARVYADRIEQNSEGNET